MKRLSADGDRTPDYWDSVCSSMSAQSLWRKHSDQVNVALLEEWLGDRKFHRLLKTDLFDEALTEGLYPALQRYGKHVYGIDLSSTCVKVARQKHPGLRAVRADVRDLPFDEGQFDAIVSNSTLDHFESIEDIHTSLAELFRVLGRNGELLITLDNLQNPIIRLRSLAPFAFWKRLGVVPYYVGPSLGRSGLVRALERTGFRVMDTSAIMHCPRVLVVPVANMLQRHGHAQVQKRFLSLLLHLEKLGTWPSRFFTGHFVAARAVKP